MKPGVATRLRAAELVVRIVDEGAHSNVVVAAERSPRHGEIERLVMDTLRRIPAADAVLAEASARPLNDLDPMVRAALRVGVTELLCGGDPHGIVDSTVEVVRETGLGRAAGFVNAVLRTIVRSEASVADDPALATGTAPWIRSRLAATWGDEEADAFLVAALQPPAIGVRLRPGAASIGDPVEGIATARHAAFGDIDTDAGHVVMDPSSTAVALAVEARPDDVVLDAAAAPGNKTSALWDAMEGRGLLVAADRHRRRTRSAQRRMRGLGVDAPWLAADMTTPPFAVGTFDRALLDAPCTGLGTLRRRPEIKLRLDPESPERMAAVQRRLVEAVLPLLKPGGRLVYSVCTVFEEETTEIAKSFGGQPPKGLPGRTWGDGLLLAPHITGTDAMYVTVFGS